MLIFLQVLFAISILFSTGYWLVLITTLKAHKEDLNYDKNPNASIIISAKNEAKRLKKTISSIIRQNSIQELIIMDDYSTDKTKKLLTSLEADYPLLRSFSVTKDVPGKKLALTEAISKAQSSHILLTDADCQPQSDQWAVQMSNKIHDDQQMVLGYGPLKKTTGIVNLFSRFETIFTAIQYFAYAKCKLPYMGVGRNLIFTKDLFAQTQGYTNHLNHPSGDDDLFVQQARKFTEIGISLDPDTFVFSNSVQSLGEYMKQKKRHLSTANRYDWKHQVLLSIHPLFHLLSISSLILLMIFGTSTWFVFAFPIRWLLIAIYGYSTFKKLDGRDIVFYLPFLDLLLAMYYVFFSIYAFFPSQNKTW